MRIRWTDPAVRDFTQICDYIEKRSSGRTARRVALSIYGRIQALAKFPDMGRTGRQPETRELVFAGLPYLAVYRSREDVVEILRILHGAQQWPDAYFINAALILSYVSSSASGSTRLSPVTVMKLVSPTQRGSTCMWTWPATPAPAARPMFMPTLMPSGE